MSGKVCQLLDQLLHKCEFTTDLNYFLKAKANTPLALDFFVFLSHLFRYLLIRSWDCSLTIIKRIKIKIRLS